MCPYLGCVPRKSRRFLAHPGHTHYSLHSFLRQGSLLMIIGYFTFLLQLTIIFTSDLREHINKHSNKHGVLCPVCGKKLTSSNLSRHLKTVHVSKEDRLTYLCPACGFPYSTKAKLQSHVKKGCKNKAVKL